MRPATQIPTVIRFEDYELDLSTEELRKNGFSLKLQPQPFKILAYLAAHPGALVSRQELRDHVWPGDTFVDFDLAINRQADSRRSQRRCREPERYRHVPATWIPVHSKGGGTRTER